MLQKRQLHRSAGAGRHLPSRRRGKGETAASKSPPDRPPPGQEPRGIEKRIADADKVSRTGSTEEPVRNTPPAGAWNDTSSD
jgi:hypothetical protein